MNVVIKATVATYGSVNKAVGWDHHREVEFDRERVTVKEVLESVRINNEESLFDLVAHSKGVKPAYSVFLNGRYVQDGRDLEHEVADNDVITAMDFFRMLIGG